MIGVPHTRDGAEIRCDRFTVRSCDRPAVHDYHAVTLHLSGRPLVTQDGRWEVVPGDLQLVPAGTPHQHDAGQHDAAEPAEGIGVAFCAACVTAGGLGDLLRPFDAVRRGRSPLLRPPDAVGARIRALLLLLEDECRRTDTTGPRARRALLELLLLELGRLDASATVPASDGLVADTLAWLETHAFEDIGPSDVAAALARSPTHLTTVVRARTGQTIGQWIVALRMAEARRRLGETDERIDVVGERVGYLDPSHFSRVFRRVHGISPTDFRRTRGAPPSGRG